MQKQINRGYDSNCLDFYLNFAFDIAFGSDNSLGLVASNTLSFCQNSLAAFYFVPIYFYLIHLVVVITFVFAALPFVVVAFPLVASFAALEMQTAYLYLNLDNLVFVECFGRLGDILLPHHPNSFGM